MRAGGSLLVPLSPRLRGASCYRPVTANPLRQVISTTPARPLRNASRTRLVLLVVTVAAAVALLAVVGATDRAPHPYQRPADREAAAFADGYLRSLLATAAGADAAAESILIGSPAGQRFSVAVFSY